MFWGDTFTLRHPLTLAPSFESLRAESGAGPWLRPVWPAFLAMSSQFVPPGCSGRTSGSHRASCLVAKPPHQRTKNKHRGSQLVTARARL